MPELTILGIAAAPIIVALIQLFKIAGLPVQYAPWINAGLSVVAYAVAILIQNGTIDATIAAFVLNALVIFLTAAGVYDRVQSRIEK